MPHFNRLYNLHQLLCALPECIFHVTKWTNRLAQLPGDRHAAPLQLASLPGISRFTVHVMNEMDQTHCPACLDLQFDLFDPGVGVVSDELPSHLVSARYITIEFEHLRTAAAAGCQNCTILERGACLFWGYHPEEWEWDDRAPLLLKSRPGKGLIAL